MSTTTVGRLVPLEFHQYAKEQGLSLEYGQVIQEERVLDVIIVHEENEILQRLVLPKNDPDYAKKFNDAVKSDKWDSERVLQDPANAVFIEKRRQPKAFICRYRGPYKWLRNYIYGIEEEDAETGFKKYVQQPHLRTWCYGMENPGGGPAFVEKDLAKVKEAVTARGKFSEIVETDWVTLQKMR